MKTWRNWSLVLFGVLALAGTTPAQEKKPGSEGKKDQPGKGEGTPPGMSAEQAAEMQAWMKSSIPGPEHKQLEYMVGNFDVAVKSWMDPTAPPMESKGTSTAEWILGGRWVRHTFTGDFMGMAFEGRGITGFDNIDKKYVSIWVDTMMTGLMHDTGTYDPASRTFTFTGEFKSPLGKIVKSRTTIRVNSNDQHLMNMYHTEQDKPETKVMELTYNRTKAPPKP